MQNKELSLYLHIPFCDSKCGYCAFNSKTNKNHLKSIYMQKLAVYLHYKLESLQERVQITSVYIGGGTPSVVESYLYENIFEEFLPFLKKGAEISIEANPNHLSLEWLRAMRDYGVNRLSIGVQSFNAQKLAFLEREHKNKNTFLALDYAVKAGFDNLSIDLIYGTPLCDEALLEQELKTALGLPLSHISAYHLSLDPGSRFYREKEQIYKESQRSLDGDFGGFLSIGHFIAAHLQKFLHYEVSNYGKASLHNLHYWSGGDYIGIGAGAVGCIQGIRTSMPKSIEHFLEDFSESKEILTQKDKELEHLFLGFRSCVGVERKKISNQKNLEILLQDGILFQKDERVFAKDYFLGDEITLFLS
ncbi:radical SAM family heme chaperone HemW [Helicobacter winghamensis]|uniref:Heme chaperone HemW n=1 Tax=Helicobacter winghamensis TaxID=157268 RepID=A0A2N3PJS8_9HELI|nr:radical SAM family heme chaperone HemW [Helicobacter winghamensis]EEO26279.1 putative oxygen-independent coproporphyrinogen III oxidase [Helicobacter winghamensis ATCC BAA-430]PKT77271.1 coproporphyrinogen III oxidase [Helicobacter winghamensis]PKT77471.1 coproporphyrinogen III oxidase [Helicobacter winghamensis]PKT77796.1 coproporphyrinogen III oxidase [Helicobacter winghamensis]PKT81437.1 coproporphyrinogen III oxidase [Helicobacter winghamensis]